MKKSFFGILIRNPLAGSFQSKYYDDILLTTHGKVAAEAGVQAIVNFYNQCDEVWTVSIIWRPCLYFHQYMIMHLWF